MTTWKDIPIGSEFGQADKQEPNERVAGTIYPWKKVNANQAKYVGRPNPSMNPNLYKWFDLTTKMVIKPD